MVLSCSLKHKSRSLDVQVCYKKSLDFGENNDATVQLVSKKCSYCVVLYNNGNLRRLFMVSEKF